MTYGVAAYKVTPEFCADELEYILSIGGIEMKYGCALGVDVTLSELAAFVRRGISGDRRGVSASAGDPG